MSLRYRQVTESKIFAQAKFIPFRVTRSSLAKLSAMNMWMKEQECYIRLLNRDTIKMAVLEIFETYWKQSRMLFIKESKKSSVEQLTVTALDYAVAVGYTQLELQLFNADEEIPAEDEAEIMLEMIEACKKHLAGPSMDIIFCLSSNQVAAAEVCKSHDVELISS